MLDPNTASHITRNLPTGEVDQQHILILSGVRGDTRRYRNFHPYEQLTLAGVPCRLAHITTPGLKKIVDEATLVLLHRITYDPYLTHLLEIIHQNGGVTILDVDDLVFDPEAIRWINSPDFHDPIRRGLYLEDMRRHRATLDACKAVTASTTYLAERARSLGKPAWVVRNAFSLEMLAISERASQQKQVVSDRLVIGYASGTPTHDRDFQVAKPALKQILHQHPRAELWLVGPLNPGSDWGTLADRIYPRAFVPWRQLPELLARFDINLAPLVSTNPFGKSKSEIKYVEAALVQVPTIATPSDAFVYAIQPGETGYLALDDEGWFQALSQLVEDPDLRARMGRQAFQDVLARYHPRVRAAELVQSLNEIHNTFQGEVLWTKPPPLQVNDHHPVSIPSKLESSPSLLQMAWYDLRYRGLHTLLMRLWIYIRRAVAPVFPFDTQEPLDD